MLGTLFIVFTLSILALCAGEGNIHLLEEEVASALRSCSQINKTNSKNIKNRQGRSDANIYISETGIDYNTKLEMNPYNHVFNDTNFEYKGYKSYEVGEKLNNNISKPDSGSTNNNDYAQKKVKKNEPLLSKDDNNQCLSQCVFADLQVVDAQGIPREAQLWKKVQTSVVSQQSRVLLRDQIRACFEELQSESEDNICSYSNKLDRCLMLRFSDRKMKSESLNISPM